MASLTTPLTTTARPPGGARALGALWARLVRRPAPEGHDPSLRAGVERPAAPMLVSISLGGPAHLR